MIRTCEFAREWVHFLSLWILFAIVPFCFAAERQPFIVPNVRDSAGHLFVCETHGRNLADVIGSALGACSAAVVRIAPLPNGQGGLTSVTDPWVQDGLVFGMLGRKPAVLEMPGERAFRGWASVYFKDMVSSGRLLRPWKNAGQDDEQGRFDCGGNLMSTPPVKGYPFGRLLVGRDMSLAIRKFLASQKVQCDKGGLVELETRFLHVGHVDEIIGFLPSDTKLGFKLISASPLAGLRLLDLQPKETPLFCKKGSQVHIGRVTGAGIRFLEDSVFDFGSSSWNYVRILSGRAKGLVARVYQAQGHRLLTDKVFDFREIGSGEMAGMTATSALHFGVLGHLENMPIWPEVPENGSQYLAVSGSLEWVDNEAAPFPAFIQAGELQADKGFRKGNMRADSLCRRAEVLVREALGGIPDSDVIRLPVLFTAAPDGQDAFSLVPSLVNFQIFNRTLLIPVTFFGETDPFEAEARRLLSLPGFDLRFVDVWDDLHRKYGGIHCGTNVQRIPSGIPSAN